MNKPAIGPGRTPLAAGLIVCLLVFWLFGGQQLSAQESEDESKLDRAFLARFGRDFRDVISSPGRWERRDLLAFAAVTGTGLLLFAFDQDIQDWVLQRRTSTSERAASFFSLLGDGAILLGFNAALYAFGEIGKDPGLRRTALLSLESLATATAVVWTLKVIFGRARPYTGESSRSFHPFALKSSYWSLPSGHAIASFSVAAAIAGQAQSPLVDVFAYGLATMVALSRSHENKHWASDAFLGSALGYFIGKKICDLNKREGGSEIKVGFDGTAGRRALTISIAF